LRLEELNKKYPDSEKIAVKLASSLVSLTVKQELEDREKTVMKLEELNKRYKDNEDIIEILDLLKSSVCM